MLEPTGTTGSVSMHLHDPVRVAHTRTTKAFCVSSDFSIIDHDQPHSSSVGNGGGGIGGGSSGSRTLLLTSRCQ